MPKKQSLQDFIKNVDSDTVNNLINAQVAASKANTIELSMPVFNYDYTLSFVDDLNKLGINKAFDCNSSDLSKISEKNLYVSEAMHSAKINFHQKGIEAAGVTCLYMTFGLSPYTPKESIIFDRPFFYIIRDVDTHDIFFVGTLYNPES
jgi:serpin B